MQHSYRPFDKYVYSSENRFHTSVKPFALEEVEKIIKLDTLFPKYTGNKTIEHVVNNNLIGYKKDELEFSINPVCNFELAKQAEAEKSSWINARGVLLHANMNDNIYVSSSFYEIQSRFNDFREEKINELGHNVVPGQNRGRVFKEDGLDYAYANGYISYVPSEIFKFQLGHGKHFIGDGYRSLLLSDNAINYPYFKITSTFWNIK